MTADEIDKIKPVLHNAEVIELRNWEHETEFHEKFLKFCPNLKCLCVLDVLGNTLMGTGNQWLHRKYPTLERLVIIDDFSFEGEEKQIVELKTFFKLNPNIQTFSTTLQFLWVNRLWLKDSEIKFDRLDIEGIGFEKMGKLFDFVNELHGQGIYRRLHFFGRIIYEDDYLLHIASLRGMEKLYLSYINTDMVLPPFIGVKELNFVFSDDIKHPEALAANIPNVERIHLGEAKISDLLPFIRLSPRVKSIRVERMIHEDFVHFKDDVIDLVALNKERKQLTGARRITLHVKERIYLATKWAAMKTECSLIQRKRHGPNYEKLYHPHYLFMSEFF